MQKGYLFFFSSRNWPFRKCGRKLQVLDTVWKDISVDAVEEFLDRIFKKIEEMFDKFVLNIFFNREYLINLNTGSKQTSYLRKMVDEIGNKFLLFTGKTPLIYQHYDNC